MKTNSFWFINIARSNISLGTYSSTVSNEPNYTMFMITAQTSPKY